jgi:hypothetical protein
VTIIDDLSIEWLEVDVAPEVGGRIVAIRHLPGGQVQTEVSICAGPDD